MARTTCGVPHVRHSGAMKTMMRMATAAAAAMALGAPACGGGAKDSKPPAEPVASKTMSVAEGGTPGAADEPTGFAECDAYLAEVRYFNRCETFPREARDPDGQQLAAAKSGWNSLQGADVPEEAREPARAACSQSNVALHQAIAAAGGCVGIGTEPPLPAEATASVTHASTVATGFPECDRYLAMARQLIRCDRMPAEARRAQQQALDAAEPGWKSLADPQVPAEAKQAAADACRDAADALAQAMEQKKCPAPAP
jgi:hypothetical protein